MTRDIIIIGIGGFGREVADLIEAINYAHRSNPPWKLIGFLDDNPSKENITRANRQGHKYLGPVTPESYHGKPHFVVGISSGKTRKTLANKLEHAGWTPALLVHPSVNIGSDCRISAGTILCSGVTISTNVSLGRHVHVNPNCNIGHDTQLGNYVSVNPLAAISGDVKVGDLTLVGAGSFVFQGVRLPDETIVGASACVIRTPENSAVLVGVPAAVVQRRS